MQTFLVSHVDLQLLKRAPGENNGEEQEQNLSTLSDLSDEFAAKETLFTRYLRLLAESRELDHLNLVSC